MKRGLPKGCTVDDVIQFPDEAAQWLGLTVDYVKKRKKTMHGVINQSRKVTLFHPRTYLDKSLRRIK